MLGKDGDKEGWAGRRPPMLVILFVIVAMVAPYFWYYSLLIPPHKIFMHTLPPLSLVPRSVPDVS
jgi:hypothetical protein